MKRFALIMAFCLLNEAFCLTLDFSDVKVGDEALKDVLDDFDDMDYPTQIKLLNELVDTIEARTTAGTFSKILNESDVKELRSEAARLQRPGLHRTRRMAVEGIVAIVGLIFTTIIGIFREVYHAVQAHNAKPVREIVTVRCGNKTAYGLDYH